jgi:hypothetical protein
MLPVWTVSSLTNISVTSNHTITHRIYRVCLCYFLLATFSGNHVLARLRSVLSTCISTRAVAAVSNYFESVLAAEVLECSLQNTSTVTDTEHSLRCMLVFCFNNSCKERSSSLCSGSSSYQHSRSSACSSSTRSRTADSTTDITADITTASTDT